jgi:hypothetical protein
MENLLDEMHFINEKCDLSLFLAELSCDVDVLTYCN